MLLKAADEEALCLTCHGSAGVGATTDVLTGVQYKVALPPGSAGQDPTNASVLLGALRNGGFDQARIDAGNAARLSYLRNATAISQRPKVGVGAPEDVNSAHLALPDNGLTMPGIAWGNGANGSGAGPAVDLSCASCHNPHGNGQYRILNAIPNPTATSGTFTPVVAPGAVVTDSPADNPDAAESDTKNYTVIQTKGTQGDNTTYLLYADDVLDAAYGPTAGDYFHRNVPWMTPTDTTVIGGGPVAWDAPNGRPSTGSFGAPATAQTAFNTEITAWCSTCHTRYYAATNAVTASCPGGQAWCSERPGDSLYKYQHQTTTNRACTTCHVSHGSNATMAGAFSSAVAYPNGTVSADSRLLKIDNRGTCQACHDPTNTTTNGTYYGPLPTPSVP
jgi:cytochrome c553